MRVVLMEPRTAHCKGMKRRPGWRITLPAASDTSNGPRYVDKFASVPWNKNTKHICSSDTFPSKPTGENKTHSLENGRWASRESRNGLQKKLSMTSVSTPDMLSCRTSDFLKQHTYGHKRVVREETKPNQSPTNRYPSGPSLCLLHFKGDLLEITESGDSNNYTNKSATMQKTTCIHLQ